MSSKLRKTNALVSTLLVWFKTNARDLPWRKTRDPYAIWVSEIMLQQTQVKTVLGYWERWMKALPSVQSLSSASPEKIHKLWEGLGYYTRVRNMQKAAQTIMSDHGGRFPGDFDKILSLPGIGRYTAGAISSIAFNQPAPILDGNVMRVLSRAFGIEGDPREKKVNRRLWEISESLVRESKQECSHFNQSLMELGALICTPRQPRCDVCPVAAHCVAFRDGRVSELPQLRARVPVTRRRFAAFVTQRKGKIFVRQRPAGTVNAHLWEFPNAEITAGCDTIEAAARQMLGRANSMLTPLCQIKHSITRYRISLEVFTVGDPAAGICGPGQWLSRSALRELPFCSAHKKILQRL